jgi:hypothetical protein
MNRIIGLIIVASMSAAPVFAGTKVYVDYDRNADLESYKSFAWGPTLEMNPALDDAAPLAHAWIKNAVEYYLIQGGMIEDLEDPDLKVTYYSSNSELVQIQTIHAGYDFGGGWYRDPIWGPMGATSTAVQTYDKGTLVIDIWDVKTKHAVWRGVATGVVKENPTKMTRQIDKVIEKMVKKFQAMRRKEN